MEVKCETMELSAPICIHRSDFPSIFSRYIFCTLKHTYGVVCGCIGKFTNREDLPRCVVLVRYHLSPIVVKPIRMHQ